MIKFTARHKGRDIIGLALEKGNIKHLQKGHPVHIFGQEMGLQQDIMIFYGETQQHIIEELRKQGFKLPDPALWKRHGDDPRN